MLVYRAVLAQTSNVAAITRKCCVRVCVKQAGCSFFPALAVSLAPEVNSAQQIASFIVITHIIWQFKSALCSDRGMHFLDKLFWTEHSRLEVRPRQAAVASVLCNMVVVSSLDHALRTWHWICSPPSWLCNRWDGSAAHCQFWWPHQPAVFARSSWAESQRLIIGPYCCFIYETHSSQPIVKTIYTVNEVLIGKVCLIELLLQSQYGQVKDSDYRSFNCDKLS